MRILHVISSLDPAIGGPPVVARNLATAQSALGHEVRIAAENVPPAQSDSAMSIPPQGLRSLFSRPVPEIESAVKESEVCHLHGVWEPLLMQAAKAARQLRRPYVITPHGMLDPWSLQQKKWKKRLALRLGVLSMINKADLIHVLNADEQRLMKPLGLTASCAIIPNGISLDELDSPPDPTLFQANYGLRPYILFLSRLHYKKGLDVLVEAFASIAAHHSELDLVIAGPDDGMQTVVELKARELQLASRVRLVGPLYGAIKWSALSGATCFCLPSRQEGFSVAILEAMACHVPVVISDQCHFPEVAEAGAGIITPMQAPAVANALARVLNNGDERKAMGAAGRRLVEERFTWNRVAELTLAHYQRLIAPSAVIS